jgi:hypothetical protein
MQKPTTPPPFVNRLSKKCGIFDISKPYIPPQPVMRIALLSWNTHTILYRSSYQKDSRISKNLLWFIL